MADDASSPENIVLPSGSGAASYYTVTVQTTYACGIISCYYELVAPASEAASCCNVGQYSDMGTYAAGTSLEFQLGWAFFGSGGTNDTNGANGYEAANVTQNSPTSWSVDANGFSLDFNVSASPAPAPKSTTGSGPTGLGNNHECAATSHPINCATGNFTHTFTDISIPGNGVPIDLDRTYNSLDASTEGIFGYGWSSSYEANLAFDAAGDATFTGPDGAQTTFTGNGTNGFTAPPNIFATLVQNSDGSYTLTEQGGDTYTFAQGATTAVSGASVHELLRESDPNGYTTTLSYSGGQLTTVTDPSGRTLTFSYDANGLVSSVSDSAGRSVSYSYDAADDLTGTTDVDGNEMSFTYDNSHNLLTMTGPRAGATITNEYNASGQVVAQQDAMGRITDFTWGTMQPDGSVTNTVTSPNGNVRSETYSGGALMSLTEASGTANAETWSYTYDPDQNLVAETDPNGGTWSYSYDGAGNQTSSTDPDGNTTSATYNSFDEPISQTGGDGNTTTDSYDSDGNLLSVSRTLTSSSGDQTQTTSYAYGDSSLPGDPTTITDPDGHATTLTYDAAGDVTSSTDPDGNTTTYSYTCSGTPSAGCFSGIGLLYSQTSPRGNVAGADAANFTTKYTYDALGDELTATDPLGNITTYTYDADGDLTSTTDPKGNTTHYAYDLDDELTGTTEPGSQTKTETYDADGNLLTQTDGNSNTTHYAYNALDQQTSTTTPASEETQYTYDPVGNLKTVTNPDGQVATYNYNGDDELTSIGYSDSSTPDVSYGYDADGNKISMSDATGDSSYTYNSLGELTNQTGGTGNTVDYSYDLDGNVTAIQYPNGNTVTNAYDDADNLTSVTDWDGNETQFAYNADSDNDQITFPTTTADIDTYSYDADDAITAVTMKEGTTSLASMSYSRNADQDVASETDTGMPQPSEPLSDSYAYDNAGDPTKIDSQSGYTYNSDQELTSTPTATLAYNSEGQRTSDTPTTGSVTSYSYDQSGGLTAITPGSGTTETNTYDGSGLLASQTTGSTTNNLTWNLASGLPLLLDDGHDSYIYGPNDLPVEQINDSTGTIQFLHHDQLGSTRLITNSAGDQVGASTYSPYGHVLATTGSATSAMGYAGQYTDPNTGLIYMRARWYDPSTAQFLTPDPLQAITGQAYAYAEDDAINRTDPLGLFSFTGTVDAIKSTVESGASTASHYIVSGAKTVGTAIANHIGSVVEAGAIAVCLSGVTTAICAGATAVGYITSLVQNISSGHFSAADALIDLISTTPGAEGLIATELGFASEGAGAEILDKFAAIVGAGGIGLANLVDYVESREDQASVGSGGNAGAQCSRPN